MRMRAYRVCSLWLLLQQLLCPHFATATVFENTLVESLMKNQDILSKLQNRADIVQEREMLSEEENKSQKSDSLNGIDLQTPKHRSLSRIGTGVTRRDNDGFGPLRRLLQTVPPAADRPVVYSRPTETRLPIIYWLSANSTRAMGIGPRILLTADHDETTDVVSSDNMHSTQLDERTLSQTRSPGSSLSHLAGPFSTVRTRRLPVTSEGGVTQVMSDPTLASVTSVLWNSVPGRKRQVSSISHLQTAGDQLKLRTMTSLLNSISNEHLYHASAPVPTPQRQPDLFAEITALVTGTHSILYQPKKTTSAEPSSGRLYQTRDHLQPKDAGTSSRYDDYITPPPSQPSQYNVPVKPAPAAVVQVTSTKIPTAAPQTMQPAPTAAPRRELWPHTISTKRTTTRYVNPTPKSPYQAAGLFMAVDGSDGEGGSVTKRTTMMQGRYPTPASGTRETVCLQYLSVEHDIDCGRRTRRSAPSSRHLALLLQHYGGSASSPFTAPTLQEAISTFRNLMPLGAPDTEDNVHVKFTAHQIHNLLREHYATKDQSTLRAHSGNRSKNVFRKSAGDLQLPSDFLEKMIPLEHIQLNITSHRNRRSFNTADHRTYACNTSVTCQHFDSSVCPGGLTEMALDENDCDTCRCAVQDMVSGYCRRRTSATGVQDLHVHLCTQCQQMRHLGAEVFPSYIQEVGCHPTNAPCLNIGGSHGAQGQCHDTRFPMFVLRRNPGRCMRVNLTNGQSLIFDDWRLTQQMIRTGCQCMVDKRSPVAANLN